MKLKKQKHEPETKPIRITDAAHKAVRLYVVLNGKTTICDFVSDLIIKKTKTKEK